MIIRAIQASRNQGSQLYGGAGKQCMANSLTAISTAHQKPVSQWTVADLDEILDKGDKLYVYSNSQIDATYWSSDDLPNTVEHLHVNKGSPAHGTLNRIVDDPPFFTLNTALSSITSTNETMCLFTMGDKQPSYTCAIIKDPKCWYIFDPHSRSNAGLSVADGKATLTLHKDIESLSSFIYDLASSINFKEGHNVPFEIIQISVFTEENEDTNSEWSGFSELSEGEIACKLYLANENIQNAMTNEISDFSDTMSCISDCVSSNQDPENDYCLLDDSLLNHALDDMNSSASFLQTFDENTFSEVKEHEAFDSFSNGNISVSDSSKEASDEDDDIPLINFVKNSQARVLNQDANVEKVDNTIESQNEDTTCSTSDMDSSSFKSATNISNTPNGRSRKRVRNPNAWKRNIVKRLRNEGKEYVTRKGIIVKSRNIKPGCGIGCRYHCHKNISTDERQKKFHSFWKLGSIVLQRNFISKYAIFKNKFQSVGKSDRRKNSVWYTLPTSDGSMVVCKTFFLDTISISERYVTTTQKLTQSGICQTSDKRGKHCNRTNKISQHQINLVRQHIESFPTVKSHYCRKDTSKEYLSHELNVMKMYSLYKEKCDEQLENPVSPSFYRKVFDFEYNLSFHRPIKDQCDLCVSYINANDATKETLKVEYDSHIENKNNVRSQKQNDKDKSKYDQNLACACFDLQEVLVTPKSFEGSLYYRRRLNNYNFTIYDMSNSNGHCYLWNECIASRGACEIASCVFDYIKQKCQENKKEFIFYNDNCAAQNKNKFYLTMLWYAVNKYDISITHKYLQKGHTQNENDSVHATIESASKLIKVYTTSQWASVISTARRKQPYFVKQLCLTDFFDFKELSKNIKNFDTNTDGDKVTWNKIKILQVSSELPNYFSYKISHGGELFQVDLFKRIRTGLPDANSLSLRQLRNDYRRCYDKMA